MAKRVLITGGAGFIGSHLTDELIRCGYKVRVLDNLSEQVHGKNCKRPDYLHPEAELIVGDVRDKDIVKESLKGIDAVYHFAALVGVGQSMYKVNDYVDVNNTGTSVLLEALVEKPVRKLVVASSMSIYGEGLYLDKQGNKIMHCERKLEDLKKSNWELYNQNGHELIPVPTTEDKHPSLSSIYALTKYDQEKMCLMIGQAYNIPTVAMRFFNVYGTRQALSNPYTGVLAIFASQLLNNNQPMVFEDGLQQRDFINVKDVAKACRLALEKEKATGEVFNVGSGNKYTINEIATCLAGVTGNHHILPKVTGKYRVGDIRHCFSDMTKSREILGFVPEISFEEGLTELAEWLQDQSASDHVSKASKELETRGLTV
ncbi:NAD-dependent epimerase/dehydratase family protein [Cytophagaceae bacterium ABcell3]|nr:NAD-dependent epimerase/dehydratase family protein [Cytophagaceae bacterium ABcell3]